MPRDSGRVEASMWSSPRRRQENCDGMYWRPSAEASAFATENGQAWTLFLPSFRSRVVAKCTSIGRLARTGEALWSTWRLSLV